VTLLPSLDLLLFVVLPYVAIAVALVGTIERYLKHPFTCSTHSTQFLENRQHFWGSVPFHFGILIVLLGHVAIFALPGHVLAWNANPSRLMVLESVLLASGILATAGFVLTVARRIVTPRVRVTTRPFDGIVYALLFLQIGGGVAVAVTHLWGSSWLAATAVPYLRSVILLKPDVAYIAPMPPLVKAHIVLAYILLAVFPFSRLVHIVAVPNAYLWRKPLVVRWYRRPQVTS
jgi:nitrate reductase gamma subunit